MARARRGLVSARPMSAAWLVVPTAVLALALLAQVSIPLPWTPVPLTGQTFAVYLIALSLGRRRGCAAVAAYLGLGWAGLPVFALGSSRFSPGPTLGYLVGMLAAAWLVGSLADRGWSRSLPRAWAACALGSFCVFAAGLAWLSRFVPANQLLGAGLLPFLPGDAIKTALAASVASEWKKRRRPPAD
jgi:biotin transport system substrate-specific component